MTDQLPAGKPSLSQEHRPVQDEIIPLAEETGAGKGKRRLLLLLLGLLLLLLIGVCSLSLRYLWRPAPLPDLLPLPVQVNYAPHYLYSIYGVDRPIGIALSPGGDRVYVAESDGERMVKILDPDGSPQGSFAPPRSTQFGRRSPVYIATDPVGRVFVTDRLQHGVFVYDSAGEYLDTILSPDLTLSEYIASHVDNLAPGATFAYNGFEPNVFYQAPEGGERILPAPERVTWAPLGIWFDKSGRMLLTDVDSEGSHVVRVIPSEVVMARSWRVFDPPKITFGAYGQGNGQFIFPNAAVVDSQGRVYVTDGNNGRISVWDGRGSFLFHFGQGAGEGALNLPRGAAIDREDRLHIVDTVGQNVKVYDVSGPEIGFLYAFGSHGIEDGQFDYPADIALDDAGRLYITDRENNRVQVWLY